MPSHPRLTRRSVLVDAAALAGGAMLGFGFPVRRKAFAASAAADGASTLTAWVVIRPDDSIVIKVARSEIGQGILTALPMLVAEELECDWTKVKPEYVAPEENLRRNRVWGDMSTGRTRPAIS